MKWRNWQLVPGVREWRKGWRIWRKNEAPPPAPPKHQIARSAVRVLGAVAAFLGHIWFLVAQPTIQRNRAYHTANDTPGRLDYPRMAQVVIAVSAALKRLE